MDTNINFKISIPKPCYEDWNKFTPDESRGTRDCKVCSKSVHDFTKKEPEQIKAILIEEMSAGNKVCGRFNEDQLTPDTPTLKGEMQGLDTYSLNFQRMKKFAMALFLVFGGFLFNSTKSTAQKRMGKIVMPKCCESIRGEIAIAKDPEPQMQGKIKVAAVKTDSAKTTRPNTKVYPKCGLMPKGDVMVEPIEDKYVWGGVTAMPVEPPTPLPMAIGIKGNAIIKRVVGQTEVELPMVTGNVAVVKEPITDMGWVVVIEEPVVGDTIITAIETIEETEPIIIGLMIAVPETVELPFLIDPIPSDSVQQLIDGEFAVEESTYVETPTLKTTVGCNRRSNQEDNSSFQGGGQLILSSYPNPSSNGIITLRYTIPNSLSLGEGKGEATISLFDLKGNLVKILLPLQTLYASSYETKYDVSDLNAGIYFCELMSGNNKTTARIVISK